MSIIGVTATRFGLTRKQTVAFAGQLYHRLLSSEVAALHHGCCIGGDEDCVLIVTALFGVVELHAHPANMPDFLSQRGARWADVLYDPKPALERNQDIVNAVEVLFAMPQTSEEVQRSGTWATVRAARRKGIPIVIIGPDGYIACENLPSRPDDSTRLLREGGKPREQAP